MFLEIEIYMVSQEISLLTGTMQILIILLYSKKVKCILQNKDKGYEAVIVNTKVFGGLD